eukprot:scaffold65000_cov47-Prasinocladus_malaysianus.AAC.1
MSPTCAVPGTLTDMSHSNNWRLARNSLARHLVVNLRQGVLEPPFDSEPSDETLLLPPATSCSGNLSSACPSSRALFRSAMIYPYIVTDTKPVVLYTVRQCPASETTCGIQGVGPIIAGRA